MTPLAIPERSTSRYAGQYARSIDPLRLLEIYSDSRKIALTSKSPATARARFELAVEAYHQLLSMGLPSDVRSSVQGTMTTLVDQFGAQLCLNEALGFCARARKLKTTPRKLEYLQRARALLQAWMAQNPHGASSIQVLNDTVLAEISQVEAVAANSLTSRET